MKKIVVLHDVSSFNDLQVLENLQSLLAGVEVLPVEISSPYTRVMRNLLRFCYDNHPDVIIGVSVGALYAQQMHGYRKVLINPKLHVSWESTYTEEVQFGGITNFDKEHSYIYFADDESQAAAYNEYVTSYRYVVKYPKGIGVQELLDSHIRPIVKKLVYEEYDKKNIDAITTNELLLKTSLGGAIGHSALHKLEEALEDVMHDVTKYFYDSFYDVRETAWEGFRKATREFVSNSEHMSSRNYTKHIYEYLYSYFEADAQDTNFLLAADAGKDMPPRLAMRELAYFFTHSVAGTYENTVCYEAGNEWLTKYKEDSSNKDELSLQDDFYDAIPLLVDYDRPPLVIADMELKEKKKIAVESYCFTTAETMKALCWGIHEKYADGCLHDFYMLMKVLVNEDNIVYSTEKGIFFDKYEAEEAMLDWTANNREHLLCYIMRIVPRCEQFYDEYVKAVRFAEGEELIDDMSCKEFVYQSTGFRRTFNFKEGYEVKYICFDGEKCILRQSSISQLSENNTVCLCDGNQVPGRYVFPLI